jgi:hypothetical protein
MNVRIRRPFHTSLIFAVAAVGTVLVLAAGCSAAPPGAVNSPVVGPARTGADATKFASFPQPTRWNGLNDKVYVTVVKPKTGTAKHEFRVTVRSEMVFWLSCLGAGKAQLSSAAIDLKWEIPCGNGDDPVAINVEPKADVIGHVINVLVAATKGARWEVRVDRQLPGKTT